jgi:hypothetical protein
VRPVIDSNIQNFAVANLRRRPEPVETGGFVVGIDPSTTSHHVNYATPLPGIEPTSADVAALVSAFRERGLTPRLEFAPNAAPAVEAALYAAGFTVEEEHEYLVCVRDSLVPPDNPPLVEAPETDADYLAVDAALAEAFGDEFTPSPQGVARLRRIGEMGGAVRLVRAPDGDCAGAASCSAPAVGTSELAGVGTRPAYRGRGYRGRGDREPDRVDVRQGQRIRLAGIRRRRLAPGLRADRLPPGRPPTLREHPRLTIHIRLGSRPHNKVSTTTWRS